MILQYLSSQIGERSEHGNQKAALLVLENPTLLDDIRNGLLQKDADLTGDCAEVCTMVAEQDPELIAPLADILISLLTHKNTRVRWESMHALALIAPFTPGLIADALPTLESIFRNDKSIIVRDNAIIAARNLAQVGPAYAKLAYPLLNLSLTLHATKQAKHGLDGFRKSAIHLQDKKTELEEIADLYMQSPRPSIQGAAKSLQKTLKAI